MDVINNEKEALLFFADISGYTEFVKKHTSTWAHGQFIISELLKIILQEIDEPLKIAKIEGDAIFFYLPIELTFDQKLISNKLLKFFSEFDNKKLSLNSVRSCECQCCSNVEKLKLKIIVHFGKVLIYQIKQFQELSGLDVIILHRLSKNSVQKNEYLMLTENAFNKIAYFKDISFTAKKEHYEDIGNVNTLVYFPSAEQSQSKEIISSNFEKFIFKFKLLFMTFYLIMRSILQLKFLNVRN
ncbi:DUF2652 domain-containing protein [Pigmentibacter ruber]|uniref:DUF2652 domain-containing protein n=1 Tax=Pigmentibacter ruber TaxID=2683196 RepID=UPI00131D5A11|nr:DUF2652 domain-containing protein [Pigmentibacter ruber]BFD33443.1 hypothetical protein GTC16762_30610 [Pigmentibacter ruber]